MSNIVSMHTLYCDGASRGNPGPSAIGYAIYSGEEIVAEQGIKIPNTTNNVAEYSALIYGLEHCQDLKIQNIIIKSDSQLLIRQLSGEYKVKNPALQVLFQKAKKLLTSFQKITLEHIPRELNSRADGLANEALDNSIYS